VKAQPLLGRQALVTGGAVRVGQAIALELARRGSGVMLHYGRSKAPALATAQAVRALGVPCRLLQADLSRSAGALSLGRRALAGGCDLLVNSASIFPRVTLDRATPKDFDEPYAVNLRAPALLTQVLGTAWAKARRRAHIVNIADIGGRLAWPGALPYSLSKAGLLQLTRASAAALAPTVLVNAVLPGPILMPEGATPAQRRSSEARSLLHRLGGPQEVADAVAFLAQSGFITGSELVVDGGRQWAAAS
jgi:NAD(P)-dependent dehydrogenase (short-subunit alcohol dehydrogenase family)